MALTSDLLDSPSSIGQKSHFLDFLGEDTPTPRDRTAKLAKVFRNNCSEKQFKRM
jgi:hypothetical protein